MRWPYASRVGVESQEQLRRYLAAVASTGRAGAWPAAAKLGPVVRRVLLGLAIIFGGTALVLASLDVREWWLPFVTAVVLLVGADYARPGSTASRDQL